MTNIALYLVEPSKKTPVSKEQEICLDFTINIFISSSPINIFSLYELLYDWHLGGTVEAVDLTTIGFATLME